MSTMNITQARSDLYNLAINVNENSEPVLITNNKGKNCVLISESDWNAIQETLYLNSIPGMAKSILDGKISSIDECIPENEVVW